MNDFTKSEIRAAVAVIRKGILHRHAQWQNELRALLDEPLAEDENEFDRNMKITKESKKFFKEAMRMEDFYRNTFMSTGLAHLYRDGHISSEDFASLPENVRKDVLRYL